MTANESVHVGVLLLVGCVCVCACVYLRISVRKGINAWVTDPRAQPLYSDLIRTVLRPQDHGPATVILTVFLFSCFY